MKELGKVHSGLVYSRSVHICARRSVTKNMHLGTIIEHVMHSAARFPIPFLTGSALEGVSMRLYKRLVNVCGALPCLYRKPHLKIKVRYGCDGYVDDPSLSTMR